MADRHHNPGLGGPRSGRPPTRLRRIAALQRNKEWQLEYRTARALWLAGFENVVFPYGTYWLRRFANVPVKPPGSDVRSAPPPLATN